MSKSIDDLVDQWHKSGSALPLEEYLGLTWEQYAGWVEGHTILVTKEVAFSLERVLATFSVQNISGVIKGAETTVDPHFLKVLEDLDEREILGALFVGYTVAG